MYKSFEALLEELGIQIEFSSDEFGSQEITRNFTGEDRFQAGNDDDLRVRPGTSALGRSRRASSNSLYDAEGTSTRESHSRPQSRASMSRLQSKEPTLELRRPSTRATTRPTEKTQTQPLYTRSIPAQPSRNRLTAQEFASNLQHYQKRHASYQRRAPNSTEVKAATAKSRGFVKRVDSLPATSASASIDLHRVGESYGPQSAYAVDQRALFYRPSDTQLMRDVETFQYYRTYHVSRAAFEKWCGSAFQARKEHKSMEQQATSRDIDTLLRNGFDQWRAHCQRKRRAAETERLFSHREQKASKHRDLWLLVKAFSHWAECSSEVKIQSSRARKRFLEFKYFNAWLDLTTVNSLKVRRQQLSRVFKIWRQRVAQASADHIRAVLLYNHSVAKTAYWSWFWTFCEMRAPVWRDNRLKKRLFLQWEIKQQQLVQREQRTLNERKYGIAKRHFSIWLVRIQGLMRDSQAAFSFNRSKLITRAILVWRRRTYHAPLMRQASNVVDWRVAGTIFGIVIARYRKERQANLVTRIRVMRNAWTCWNDQLRQQTLVRRIDDRVVVEALYRWVVGERCILLSRLHQQRIRQRALSSLMEHWSDRKEHRDDAARTVEATANRNCVASVMKHWRSKMDSCDLDERLAFEFHAPRVAQEVLQLWTAKSAHLQKLQVWVKDAEFFFLATKLIKKRWHGVMIEAKRQKRRNAYAQLRRTIKMRLATRVLHRWRHMTAHTRQLMEEACLRDQGRLLRLGSGMFDEWRIQAGLRVAQGDQAEQHFGANLTAQHLSLWSGRIQEQWRMTDLANLNDKMRVHSIASHWLHKLRLLVIEVTRGPEANAQSLKEFHEKRRFYNLFRRWQGKTATSLHRPIRGSALSSRSRQPGFSHAADYSEDTVTRAAARTAFDEGFDLGEWNPTVEAQISVTPSHGYLSTPSKRAARAKAMVGASTTPAGTPFQFRLRSQLATEPRSAPRNELAKSTTLRDSVFAAIVEASPRTPLRG